MAVPVQFEDVAQVSAPPKPLHLAIGMFDGVHLGHRAVIEAAVQSARSDGGLAGVLTFWPHPSALLRPDNPTHLLQDAATKARLLGELGVDFVVTQRFTTMLAGMSADDFLPWLQSRLPRLAAIYVGENFRFGRGRKGDVALLVAAGRRAGVHVFSAPRVNLNGEPISSTRVRAHLAAGDIEAVNALLGHHYTASGRVTPGKRLGRTIGFPTLNVPWSPGVAPRFGVYVVRVADEAHPGGLAAVANYGLRPTVEQASDARLEVHVLGECPWREGDDVRIEWLRFLRPEMKFASLDELRAQIARDREAAAAFFRR